MAATSTAAGPGKFLFASESATEGCPDKLCDRVSEAVVDALLAGDPESRVSCETTAKPGMVMILGEVVSKASVNYEQLIRETVKAVGYDSDEKGWDWRSTNVIVALDDLSADLAAAASVAAASVSAAGAPEDGASAGENPSVVFGYATDETPEMMPLSHVLSSKLCAQLDKVRKDGTVAWARPCGTAQVVLEYSTGAGGAVVPARVHSVTLSVQHAADAKPEQVEKDLMDHVVKPVLPGDLCDANTVFRLAQGKQGPGNGNVGMTGRRLGADMYGGWGNNTSASPSGKDGAKVGRAATYGARWAALSLVAGGLCKRCSVQLTYARGNAEPVAISVDSYGTSQACGKTDADLAEAVKSSFDLRPRSLQKDLGLKTPRFQKLAAYGHMGRTDLDLPWEFCKELK